MISLFGGVGGSTCGSPWVVKIGTAPRREYKNATCAAMVCHQGSNIAAHVCHIKSMFDYVSKIGKKWVSYWFFTYGLKCVEITQEGILVRKLRHEFLGGKNNLHPNRFRDKKVYVMTQFFSLCLVFVLLLFVGYVEQYFYEISRNVFK